MSRNKVSVIWIYVLVLMFGYFLYQLMFTWDKTFKYDENSVSLEQNQTVFLTISEKPLTMKKASFASLRESLTLYEFDKRKDEVKLKFPSLLPKPQTMGMVIYDRDIDAFERYSEVFSVPVFPYNYKFNNKPLLTVYHVDKDGTAFIEFRGKKIRLEPYDTYRSGHIEGYQWINTTIENHGIYSKEQFKAMKKNNKKK